MKLLLTHACCYLYTVHNQYPIVALGGLTRCAERVHAFIGKLADRLGLSRARVEPGSAYAAPFNFPKMKVDIPTVVSIYKCIGISPRSYPIPRSLAVRCQHRLSGRPLEERARKHQRL